MITKLELEKLKEGRKYLMSGSVGGESPLLLVSGKGAIVKDIEEKEYIDCTSQAWSYNVGVSHPKVVAAVVEQVKKLSHARTSFDTIPKLKLLKKLGELAPGNLKKISFCLHGSVASEGALKLAMINKPEATKFLTLFDNYSGRTLATIAASWPYHPISKVFAPFMQNFIRVPNPYCYRSPFKMSCEEYGDFCAEWIKITLKKATEPVAAIIMEPFQASGGMIGFPSGYLKRVREICDEEGILLIFDEIQTGFGRLGEMFASELYNVIPDILVFGKALGGGFPIAGVMMRKDLKGYTPASHSFTFAHFPVSFAAACATLEVIEEENLLEKCQKMGEYFTSHLLKMKEKYEIIGDVRGPGLMIGIELVKNRKTKEPACKEANWLAKEGIKKGVIFGMSKFSGLGNVVKIKPPFVITYKQADKVLEVFEDLVKSLTSEVKGGR